MSSKDLLERLRQLRAKLNQQDDYDKARDPVSHVRSLQQGRFSSAKLNSTDKKNGFDKYADLKHQRKVTSSVKRSNAYLLSDSDSSSDDSSYILRKYAGKKEHSGKGFNYIDRIGKDHFTSSGKYPRTSERGMHKDYLARSGSKFQCDKQYNILDKFDNYVGKPKNSLKYAISDFSSDSDETFAKHGFNSIARKRKGLRSIDMSDDSDRFEMYRIKKRKQKNSALHGDSPTQKKKPILFTITSSSDSDDSSSNASRVNSDSDVSDYHFRNYLRASSSKNKRSTGHSPTMKESKSKRLLQDVLNSSSDESLLDFSLPAKNKDLAKGKLRSSTSKSRKKFDRSDFDSDSSVQIYMSKKSERNNELNFSSSDSDDSSISKFIKKTKESRGKKIDKALDLHTKETDKAKKFMDISSDSSNLGLDVKLDTGALKASHKTQKVLQRETKRGNLMNINIDMSSTINDSEPSDIAKLKLDTSDSLETSDILSYTRKAKGKLKEKGEKQKHKGLESAKVNVVSDSSSFLDDSVVPEKGGSKPTSRKVKKVTDSSDSSSITGALRKKEKVTSPSKISNSTDGDISHLIKKYSSKEGDSTVSTANTATSSSILLGASKPHADALTEKTSNLLQDSSSDEGLSIINKRVEELKHKQARLEQGLADSSPRKFSKDVKGSEKLKGGHTVSIDDSTDSVQTDSLDLHSTKAHTSPSSKDPKFKRKDKDDDISDVKEILNKYNISLSSSKMNSFNDTNDSEIAMSPHRPQMSDLDVDFNVNNDDSESTIREIKSSGDKSSRSGGRHGAESKGRGAAKTHTKEKSIPKLEESLSDSSIIKKYLKSNDSDDSDVSHSESATTNSDYKTSSPLNKDMNDMKHDSESRTEKISDSTSPIKTNEGDSSNVDVMKLLSKHNLKSSDDDELLNIKDSKMSPSSHTDEQKLFQKSPKDLMISDSSEAEVSSHSQGAVSAPDGGDSDIMMKYNTSSKGGDGNNDTSDIDLIAKYTKESSNVSKRSAENSSESLLSKYSSPTRNSGLSAKEVISISSEGESNKQNTVSTSKHSSPVAKSATPIDELNDGSSDTSIDDIVSKLLASKGKRHESHDNNSAKTDAEVDDSEDDIDTEKMYSDILAKYSINKNPQISSELGSESTADGANRENLSTSDHETALNKKGNYSGTSSAITGSNEEDSGSDIIARYTAIRKDIEIEGKNDDLSASDIVAKYASKRINSNNKDKEVEDSDNGIVSKYTSNSGSSEVGSQKLVSPPQNNNVNKGDDLSVSDIIAKYSPSAKQSNDDDMSEVELSSRTNEASLVSPKKDIANTIRIDGLSDEPDDADLGNAKSDFLKNAASVKNVLEDIEGDSSENDETYKELAKAYNLDDDDEEEDELNYAIKNALSKSKSSFDNNDTMSLSKDLKLNEDPEVALQRLANMKLDDDDPSEIAAIIDEKDDSDPVRGEIDQTNPSLHGMKKNVDEAITMKTRLSHDTDGSESESNRPGSGIEVGNFGSKLPDSDDIDLGGSQTSISLNVNDNSFEETNSKHSLEPKSTMSRELKVESESEEIPPMKVTKVDSMEEEAPIPTSKVSIDGGEEEEDDIDNNDKYEELMKRYNIQVNTDDDDDDDDME